LECPNCHTNTQESFKFCPNCAFQLEKEATTLPSPKLDPTELSKSFGTIENPAPLAKRAKLRLRKLGSDNGYKVVLDYENPKINYPEKSSFVDVVWMSDEKIVAAFEVRAKTSELNFITSKSALEKLKNLEAEEKFIVYVSFITGKANFNPVGDDTAITKRIRGPYLPYNIEEIRKTLPRAYEPWTSAEIEDLVNGFKGGASARQLAFKHQRGIGAIVSRLKKLGLLEE